MLSKKAIAAFAAVATFVSGIAFAMPALASSATPVPANSGGKSAKHPSVAKLENRVKNSGLLKSEIDELLKYVSKNDSKVTGSGDANNAVVKYVDDKIVEYRARHLDVIGLHDLAKQVREASNFQSASQIFYGSKDKRDNAQSAYVNGKAALVKKAKDEGLTLVANKIKESNYSSLASLENLLNESEKYAKEDLIKQAKAKKFNFTATLMSKAATLNGARALLNEAQKTITDSAIKGIVDLGTSEEDFLEYLKKVGKTATPSQIELFRKESQKRRATQEKSYNDAVELAQLAKVVVGTVPNNEKVAIAKFFAVVESFGNKTFDKLTTAEANKAATAVVELNRALSENLKNAIKNYKVEKEKLAKQAEDQGFHFIANLIRNSKKSRLVALENLLAEAKKSKNSAREKNPGASGDVLPDKSEDKPAEKAPSAPSVSDSNATQDSSTKTESSEKTAQAKAVVPAAPKSVNDLKPELKGMLTVGSNNVAVAGSANKVFVKVSNKAFLDRLHSEGSVKAYAFMYSTPKLLRSVYGSDFVTVKLGADGVPYFDAQFPAGYSGKHTVVLVDEQGNQLAWTDITVANSTSSQGDGKGVLPVTGAAGVLVAFAALMFVAAGFALRKVRS
ncbi:hypothetical protein [Gardnerella pickettii]|uniref:LPXTG-motif protein cell wall anchor domain protein n=1 Tax=Gardnerella pickettii JCP8017A TaxID=1261062 RepID=T2PM65_9BIFI|nr:hypothetical protein [Gardnerella pickettii]EPI53311.1 LPXTG-motif protein cell wall anchor domain protein [Gardnerella pickettii JCP8017A]EPI61906.1 LPXTG-motif protein cell wall anchor domain protein [Gardnerella pickettii JCP8017B]